MFYSYQQTQQRKINAVRTLENETVDLEDNPNVLETILNEGTDFEINSKARLNAVINFVEVKKKINRKKNGRKI